MKKSKTKEIEMQKPEELWSKFNDQNSEEDMVFVFDDMIKKLMTEPNLYYIKSVDETAAIIRRADNKIIYGTANPVEIEVLRMVGIEKWKLLFPQRFTR